MKERPILLNAEMVRAVLDGRKTQTRRVMKVQPHAGVRNSVFVKSGFEDGHGKELVCPFGAVGDRLWVRETWQGPLVDYDEAYSMFKDPTPYQKAENCVYRADGGPCPEFTDADDNLRQGWRPSIHMPRWASRITLEITGVRVERLRDLSEEDAKSEGVTPPGGGVLPGWEHRINFRELWMSIYGTDNWEANPWVWVIEFKRVEANHDN